LIDSGVTSEKSVERRDINKHLSAVDPVGNYLLKRQPIDLDYNYGRPEMTSHNKRMADPVGSYLIRRRADPVGSYLLKKSVD